MNWRLLNQRTLARTTVQRETDNWLDRCQPEAAPRRKVESEACDLNGSVLFRHPVQQMATAAVLAIDSKMDLPGPAS